MVYTTLVSQLISNFVLRTSYFSHAYIIGIIRNPPGPLILNNLPSAPCFLLLMAMCCLALRGTRVLSA